MNSLHIERTQLEQLMPLIQEKLAAGHSVRFSPSGTSMLPLLVEGRDSVVLSPTPDKLKKYDLPLYKRDSGQYVLHRIVCVGETYTCIGDNQFYNEYGIRHDQIIAVVTSFTHKGKLVHTHNFLYGIYCRIWHYSRPFRHFTVRSINWLRRHFR